MKAGKFLCVALMAGATIAAPTIDTDVVEIGLVTETAPELKRSGEYKLVERLKGWFISSPPHPPPVNELRHPADLIAPKSDNNDTLPRPPVSGVIQPPPPNNETIPPPPGNETLPPRPIDGVPPPPIDGVLASPPGNETIPPPPPHDVVPLSPHVNETGMSSSGTSADLPILPGVPAPKEILPGVSAPKKLLPGVSTPEEKDAPVASGSVSVGSVATVPASGTVKHGALNMVIIGATAGAAVLLIAVVIATIKMIRRKKEKTTLSRFLSNHSISDSDDMLLLVNEVDARDIWS